MEGRDGLRDRRSMAAEAGYGGNFEQRGAPPPTPGTCYSVYRIHRVEVLPRSYPLSDESSDVCVVRALSVSSMERAVRSGAAIRGV